MLGGTDFTYIPVNPEEQTKIWVAPGIDKNTTLAKMYFEAAK